MRFENFRISDTNFWNYGQRVKGEFRPSVQDRRPEADRSEFGPRPVRPIFWDRRSRFGPVDRPSVGLWTSLISRRSLNDLLLCLSQITFLLIQGQPLHEYG